MSLSPKLRSASLHVDRRFAGSPSTRRPTWTRTSRRGCRTRMRTASSTMQQWSASTGLAHPGPARPAFGGGSRLGPCSRSIHNRVLLQTGKKCFKSVEQPSNKNYTKTFLESLAPSRGHPGESSSLHISWHVQKTLRWVIGSHFPLNPS